MGVWECGFKLSTAFNFMPAYRQAGFTHWALSFKPNWLRDSDKSLY
jgi:hypothetical protein